MKLEAVVLAGGLGTRLRSRVADVPKPMAPVAGRPFLELLLRRLARGGYGRVTLSVGYMADTIRGHFRNRFETMDVAYAVEDEPLGTGGGLRKALAQCQTSHALVCNGDTFLGVDLAQVEAAWQAHGNPLIVARPVPDASRYDVLELEGNRITGFLSRGAVPSGPVNAGTYVLPTDLFATFEGPERFSFEADFLPQAIRSRPFDAFVSDARFIDIGVPEDYERAQVLLADLA